MKDLEDWLLYIGLVVIVTGVAFVYWPAALILAGVFICGVAFMRAYNHAE